MIAEQNRAYEESLQADREKVLILEMVNLSVAGPVNQSPDIFQTILDILSGQFFLAAIYVGNAFVRNYVRTFSVVFHEH